jgi:hypothetical protein
MTGSLNLWLIPLVPFAGFLVNGLVGRKLPKVLVTAIALICTLIPFLQVAKIWFQFSSITTPTSSTSAPGSGAEPSTPTSICSSTSSPWSCCSW